MGTSGRCEHGTTRQDPRLRRLMPNRSRYSLPAWQSDILSLPQSGATTDPYTEIRRNGDNWGGIKCTTLRLVMLLPSPCGSACSLRDRPGLHHEPGSLEPRQPIG